MCIYNEKNVCVYIYICGGCLDKYISAATWPPQTKIPSFAPKNYPSKTQIKTPLTKPTDLQSIQNHIFQTQPLWSLSLSLSLYHRDRTSRPLKIMPPPPPPPPTLAPKHEMKQTYIDDDEPEKHIDINLKENLCNSISFALASTLTLMYKLKFSFFVFWVWEIWKFCRSEQKVWFDNGWFLDIFWFLYFFF